MSTSLFVALEVQLIIGRQIILFLNCLFAILTLSKFCSHPVTMHLVPLQTLFEGLTFRQIILVTLTVSQLLLLHLFSTLFPVSLGRDLESVVVAVCLSFFPH